MKRAVYSTTRHEFWLEVATLALERFGITPAYWITTSANRAAVATRFPDCICHDSLDLGRGLDARSSPMGLPFPVGDDILDALSRHEHIALEMMDRMDLDGTFHLRARKRLYLSHLSYFLELFGRITPDVLFFVVPPHLPGEYVMYAVARHLGVEVRILRPTALSEFALITHDIERLPDGLAESSLQYAAMGEGPRQATMTREIDATLGGKRPWYFEKNSRVTDRRERFREEAAAALDSAGGRVPPLNLDLEQAGFLGVSGKTARHSEVLPRAYSVPGRRLETAAVTVGEFQCYLRWSLIEKVALERAYAARVSPDPDITGNYVFLALHYQPERTTSPDGGRFSNQGLLAALIANSLPNGWRLLIKEHPNQFSFKNNGNQSRSPWFYDDLAALPHTTLLPLQMPSEPLVRGATAVATVSGFAGWEALCWGRPVLVFGTAWYQDCPGVHKVRDAAGLIAAFETINDKTKLAGLGDRTDSTRVVRGYARAIEDIGVQHLCLAPEERVASLFGSAPPAPKTLAERLASRIFADV